MNEQQPARIDLGKVVLEQTAPNALQAVYKGLGAFAIDPQRLARWILRELREQIK